MEIKTCEEYVLAELDNCQKKLDLTNERNEFYKKMLITVAKYLKNDNENNIFISDSDIAVDSVNRRCLLKIANKDRELLLALTHLADDSRSESK